MKMTVTLEEDDGDLIFPFPDEILDELGWKEGDVIEWTDNEDGSLSARKV